ncbi:peroxiredoxin [Caldiplasma sukawensis]
MDEESILNAGDELPEFETVDQDGNNINSKNIVGKPSVIYFYPKDNTPGCTTEACEFRDNMNMFKDKGVDVYGVSTDSKESHKKFQEKYGLNFRLLVDKEKEISKKFGVLNDKTAKRTTFIVGPDGKIKYVFKSVSPKGHSMQVYEKMKELEMVD